MLETQERDLTSRNGTPVVFAVTYLNGSKGQKLFSTIVKVVGPSIGVAMDAIGGDAKVSLAALVSQTSKTEVFARIAQLLVTNLDDAKEQMILSELRGVSKVQQNGTWIELSKVFELVFRGEQLMLLKWLAFALEVQFGDFLSLFQALGPSASGAAESRPQE